MDIPKSDLRVERVRGTGPGGQHRNRTASAVRLTHLPTGLQAYADERSQHRSYQKALKVLKERLAASQAATEARKRKEDRDRKVREAGPHRRSYDQTSNRVTDHRSGVKRLFDDVVRKGNLDDLLDF